MQFKTLLPSLLLVSYGSMAAADSFYAYSCDDCDCNAYQSLGSSVEGTCTDLNGGAASFGVSAGKESGTYCTLFSGSHCGGESQNVGHHKGETWGCTNTEIGWVYSVLCFN
ncbi:hypothetical protein N7466_008567 [Penicillium verhagenii]|uniref:uncharacterized protein n=1 Tax=Penicillium verhagenii TaxID=1562060 RepID=UPI0025453BD6|nr:uncharacterized protein N7466_008567 [Penicillium verhagenii]KAJ5924380.1 hypothetical protein N7466_008567 [Penicillium verhagenii]